MLPNIPIALRQQIAEEYKLKFVEEKLPDNSLKQSSKVVLPQNSVTTLCLNGNSANEEVSVERKTLHLEVVLPTKQLGLEAVSPVLTAAHFIFFGGILFGSRLSHPENIRLSGTHVVKELLIGRADNLI